MSGLGALDAAWRELEMDALASDGPIRDADVETAIKRNRWHVEQAVRADTQARVVALEGALERAGDLIIGMGLTTGQRLVWEHDRAEVLAAIDIALARPPATEGDPPATVLSAMRDAIVYDAANHIHPNILSQGIDILVSAARADAGKGWDALIAWLLEHLGELGPAVLLDEDGESGRIWLWCEGHQARGPLLGHWDDEPIDDGCAACPDGIHRHDTRGRCLDCPCQRYQPKPIPPATVAEDDDEPVWFVDELTRILPDAEESIWPDMLRSVPPEHVEMARAALRRDAPRLAAAIAARYGRRPASDARGAP